VCVKEGSEASERGASVFLGKPSFRTPSAESCTLSSAFQSCAASLSLAPGSSLDVILATLPLGGSPPRYLNCMSKDLTAMDDIFTLTLSSDSETDEPSSVSQEPTPTATATRASKLGQSELQFLQQKSSWKPVCADIQVRTLCAPFFRASSSRFLSGNDRPIPNHQGTFLPLQAQRRQQYSSATAIVTKEEVLELKAASEERYYTRDYTKSLELAVRALAVGGEMVHPVERKELLSLKEKCSRRIASLNTV
jgi:hypothetical protein